MSDGPGPYNTGDPVLDAAANQAYAARQRRLSLGWHPQGWQAAARDTGGTLTGADAVAIMNMQQQTERRDIEAANELRRMVGERDAYEQARRDAELEAERFDTALSLDWLAAHRPRNRGAW